MTLNQIKEAVKAGLTIHYESAANTVQHHVDDTFWVHVGALKAPLECRDVLNGRATYYYPSVGDILGYLDSDSGERLQGVVHGRPNRLLKFTGPYGLPLWIAVSQSDVLEAQQPDIERAVDLAIDWLERHYADHPTYPWGEKLHLIV